MTRSAAEIVVGAIYAIGATFDIALVVGGCFALGVSLLSSPGGTLGNLVLAAVQFVPAATH